MTDRQRATDEELRSPMLRRCTVDGCATIVFGTGTCVEHDPPWSTTLALLAEAFTQSSGSEGAATTVSAQLAHSP